MDGIPSASANSKMTHFQSQLIHPAIESDVYVQDMEVEITSSFDTQMNTSLSLSSTTQNQRNAINEPNIFKVPASRAKRQRKIQQFFPRNPLREITNTVRFI
jgi:hypothetical protein